MNKKNLWLKSGKKGVGALECYVILVFDYRAQQSLIPQKN
jgi:hypothetical protein